MLGWWITVTKLPPKEEDALPYRKANDHTLANWEAGVSGLGWVKQLEKEGKAILDVEGSNAGYPYRYSAPAGHVIPFIANLIERPLGNDWLKIVAHHRDRIEQCPDDATVTITAFDLS